MADEIVDYTFLAGPGVSLREDAANKKFYIDAEVAIGSALGDESSDIETGLALTWRAPFAFSLTELLAELVTAGSGGSHEIDVKKNGTSILSTKITIETGEDDSADATTQPVISTSTIAKRDKLTFHFDTVPTTPGKGPKIWLIGTRGVT